MWVARPGACARSKNYADQNWKAHLSGALRPECGLARLWEDPGSRDPRRFAASRRGNAMVSDHLRPELPLDAGPALDVADKRVKAVFVMRPASFRAFGMDQAGLRQPALPGLYHGRRRRHPGGW